MKTPHDTPITEFTFSFIEAYRQLPHSIQIKVDRRIHVLTQEAEHLSLWARKIQGMSDIWETHVGRHYRLTFELFNDVIHFRTVGTHKICDRQ